MWRIILALLSFSMDKGFETYLRLYTTLTEREIAQVAATATRRTVQRNEAILLHGQVCRHKTFVAHGLMRTYGIDAEGNEHILQFSPENTWTLDAESYDRQQPATFNIVAIERSELLQWTKTGFGQALTDIPALQAFAHQLISRNAHSGRQRLYAVLSATPEEKYELFIREYPDLLPRLPLRMIASYLGMSLKTLTRIRHAQVHR